MNLSRHQVFVSLLFGLRSLNFIGFSSFPGPKSLFLYCLAWITNRSGETAAASRLSRVRHDLVRLSGWSPGFPRFCISQLAKSQKPFNLSKRLTPPSPPCIVNLQDRGVRLEVQVFVSLLFHLRSLHSIRCQGFQKTNDCFSIVWLGNLAFHGIWKASKPHVFASLLFGIRSIEFQSICEGLQTPSLCCPID